MKPVDFRNLTFADLQGLLSGQRARVYSAWTQFSPATTRECAIKAEISILTFRPRTTELMEVGLVELAPGQKAGHEGIYRAVPMAEWQRRKAAVPARPEQTLMKLDV